MEILQARQRLVAWMLAHRREPARCVGCGNILEAVDPAVMPMHDCGTPILDSFFGHRIDTEPSLPDTQQVS